MKLKKYIIPILDVILGIYLLFAVISFNNPDEEYPMCTQVVIDIADESTYGFLNKNEIVNILQKKGLYPINKPMDSVSPGDIEDLLKTSPFVSTAQCSKSKDGKVFITITQRSPILRIKNCFGEDYYIDEKGGVMPNSSYTSDLIIATGYIDHTYAQRYLSVLTNLIMASDMWRNEIEQINILQDHGVELIPRVGDHVIFLGYLPESNSQEIREKEIPDFVNHQFDRLVLFYKYGLSQAGWNKYERIDLQYPNQIICKKKGAEMARIAEEKAAEEAAAAEQAQMQTPQQASTQTEGTEPLPSATASASSSNNKQTAKPEAKKSDVKQRDNKKPDNKKTDKKKPDNKKTDKKKETSKPAAKKQDTKKQDKKKTDTKKNDSKKSSSKPAKSKKK